MRKTCIKPLPTDVKRAAGRSLKEGSAVIEIRRILVPCDFSDFSRRALEHAAALARWYDAEIAALFVMPLLSTVDALPVAVGPVPTRPVPKDDILRELRAFVAPAADPGLTYQHLVAEGNAVDQILDHAAGLPADLIVMGTHGRSGFERWVLGSVTEKVLRKARCPVLTVPRNAVMSPEAGRPPFARILCAVDFSPSSLEALEYALTLAQEGYASITLLHAIESLPEVRPEPQGFDLARYRTMLEKETTQRLADAVPVGAPDWCRPATRIVHGKAWEKILETAEGDATDLIVMGVQGRTALDLMVFGSNTAHVIRGASCPVLTIRE